MKMHNIGGLPTLLRKNLSKLPQFFKRTCPFPKNLHPGGGGNPA
jgi:hypothetical protein